MKSGSALLVFLLASSACGDAGQPVDAAPVDADTHDAQVDAAVIDAAIVDAEPPGIDATPRFDAFWTAIPADGPGIREGAGLAFDPATQRLILLGGCRVLPDGGCFMVNDVWVLDLSSGLARARWTELSPAGVAPRLTTYGFEVSYDPVSGRLLAVVTGVEQLELWALENANGIGTPRWRPLVPTGTEAPSHRGEALIGHDPAQNRLYMHGGAQQPDFTAVGDMWMLERANGVGGSPEWSALPQEGPQPEARVRHSGTLSAPEGQMFAFAGGDNDSRLFSDGWILNLGQPVTARRFVDALPDGLVASTASYIAERRTLLFLGCRRSMLDGSCRFGATWHLRLDNESEPFWEVLLPADEAAPFGFYGSSSVYDAGSDRLFLFGVADEAGNPADVLWVLSNASVE